MRVWRLWTSVRDFLSGRTLSQTRERHRRAADRLDAAVKEMLEK